MADTRMTLLELVERCEKATGPDAALTQAIADYAESIGLLAVGDLIPDYTASLDAAMTLVPKGWRWIMREACPDKANANERGFFARLETRDFESVTWGKGSDWITDLVAGQDVHCWAATPALAICAASLRARESANPRGER
jgi:hypothetical protein